MPQFIESLENRQLFAASAQTVTADADKVLAELAAEKIAVNNARAVAAAEYNKVAADLKPLTTSKNRAHNAALLAAVKQSGGLGNARILAAINSFNTTTKTKVLKAVADGKAIAAKPTSGPLLARGRADGAAMLHSVEQKFVVFEKSVLAVGPATDKAYNAILSAYPSVNGDYTTLNAQLGDASSTLGLSFETVGQDVAQLSMDIGGPGLNDA